MKTCFLWISLLLACVVPAAPARAEPPAPEAVKEALLPEEITVENYSLDRDGLNEFYAAREDRPAWDFAGPANSASFNAFIDSVAAQIAWHGLVPEDYALDLMRQQAAQNADDVRLELLATDTLLHLAHDLHGDDLDLDQLYPGWNFKRADTDIPAALASAVAANSVNELFESLTPKNQAYRDLARGLRQYREIAAQGGWSAVDPGSALKPRDHGPRVAQLRARLAAEGYLVPEANPAAANLFDEALKKALESYQLRNGLDSDGHAGTDTLAALNVPVAGRIGQIRANMERWRHMPDDFPPSRAVIVNIADAAVEIVEDGEPVYRGPVVVGQVERKTPFIQSEIRSMIVNPSWHVPAKIARADILPKLREDPDYLKKLGIVIRDNESDPHGAGIDWKNLPDDEFNFRLRQQPGAMNSLGRLKFDFDNNFAVYLHGTPHQELFKKDRRTLSSGCVRLRDPERVAEILLAGTPGDWDEEHLEAAIAAKKTRWVALKNPIPVEIVYWSVFASEGGQIQFRADVYDYDRFLMENMKSPPEPASAAPAATP
jgi:murein L,D-transpeptidase YcbB/YkuD